MAPPLSGKSLILHSPTEGEFRHAGVGPKDSEKAPAARRTQVLIVGAGWGGLTLARRLRSVPVDVELIDRNNYRVFSPFVYQVAAGMLSPGDVAPPVRKLIRSVSNASFLKAEVTGIDAQNCRVLTDHGSLSYDYLVLAH